MRRVERRADGGGVIGGVAELEEALARRRKWVDRRAEVVIVPSDWEK